MDLEAAQGGEEPPVFVFGVPRSGTTLLFRTLLRHSAFRPARPAPGATLIESKVFQYAHADNVYLARLLASDPDAYPRYLRGTALARAVNRTLAAPPVHAGVARLPGALRATLWRGTGQARLVRKFFALLREAQGCRRVLEKTPIHYRYLPEIRATWPAARYIWIHRHPLDVYSSYLRRGRDELPLTPAQGRRWLAVDAPEFTRRWRDGVQRMQAALREQPGNHYRIAYEAFVAAPREVFRTLCAFLGIPFEEQCVIGGQRSLADPRDPLLSSAITAKPKAWQRFLAPAIAMEIQNALQPEMQSLGYAPYAAVWVEAIPEPGYGSVGHLALPTNSRKCDNG
ncbi:MAG TPA: sulfotransferase [Kiritimatiellia bacterium]|nr:sulfotransferase [Kiritimatiellia bacterium]